MAEAKSAFARLLKHHQANGWDPSPFNQAAPEPSRLARSKPRMHRSSRGDATVASTSLGPSLQPAACDKVFAVMHSDRHSNRFSAQASTAQYCPAASHEEKPALKHQWSDSHTTASPGVLPLGPSSSSPLLPPSPDQHAAATTTEAAADAEAKALYLDDSNVRRTTSQAAMDLTDSPVNTASSQQQIGIKASAAAVTSDQPDNAGPSEGMHEAATELPGPVDVSLEAGVVDLLSPVGSQPTHAKHFGDDLLPGVDAKRRRLSSEACQQVRSDQSFPVPTVLQPTFARPVSSHAAASLCSFRLSHSYCALSDTVAASAFRRLVSLKQSLSSALITTLHAHPIV